MSRVSEKRKNYIKETPYDTEAIRFELIDAQFERKIGLMEINSNVALTLPPLSRYTQKKSFTRMIAVGSSGGLGSSW